MASNKDAPKKDAPKKEEPSAEGDTAGKSSTAANPKKKIILISVVVGIVVLGLLGGTIGFMMHMLKQDDAELGALEGSAHDQEKNKEVVADKDKSVKSENKEAKAGKKSELIYIDLNPPFIVNFEDPGHQHFLQVGVSLQTRDTGLEEKLKNHMPLIRNALVMLYGAQSYEVLQTASGKQMLQEKTLKAVQDILRKELGVPGVDQVYFTQFVMQ